MSTDKTEKMLKTKTREMEQMVQQRQFGPEYRTLRDEVLVLERTLASERGEPHVIELSLGQVWSGMADFCAVVGDSFSCVIMFTIRGQEHVLLKFSSIAGYKVTDVGDEVIEGHPFSGKGLLAYHAFIVKNSPWVKELKSIDKVHPQYDSMKWQKSQHYLLSFKDRMVEVVAQDLQLVGTFYTMKDALEQAIVYTKSIVQ